MAFGVLSRQAHARAKHFIVVRPVLDPEGPSIQPFSFVAHAVADRLVKHL